MKDEDIIKKIKINGRANIYRNNFKIEEMPLPRL